MRGFENCDTTFDRVFGDDTDHIKNFRFFSKYKDYNEIGEVLAGHDVGRKNESQRIINYNYGLALHDVLFAAKIFELTKNIPSLEIDLIKEKEKFWL